MIETDSGKYVGERIGEIWNEVDRQTFHALSREAQRRVPAVYHKYVIQNQLSINGEIIRVYEQYKKGEINIILERNKKIVYR